jgi:surface antigen
MHIRSKRPETDLPHVISARLPTYRRSVAVRVGGALALSLVLAGCADTNGGNKEAIGTGAGVVLGGLAGALLGGKGGGRIAGAAVGAAVGGLIGNRVGAALDDNDRKAIAAQSQHALLSGADNTPLPWTSDHSDASATITPVNTRVETRSIAVVRDAKVASAPELDLIGRKYQAKTTTNIRLAPTVDSDIAGKLSAGDKITAVGKVRGEPWIMVARGGRTIGYVSAEHLEPVPQAPKALAATAGVPASAPTSTTAPTPSGGSNQAAAPSAFDLDADAPVRAAADLDALGPDTKVDRINAAVPCRDIKTTVTSKGQSETSTQTACKSPDGTWELL